MPDDSLHISAQLPSELDETRPARILVLDDSRAQTTLMSRLLRKWGHEVVACEEPRRALDIVAHESFDIIVTDWVMPEIDGPEFCSRFRQMERDDYSYVILLTSKSEKSEIAEGLDAGADDFLTKPVDPHELRARIRAGERIIAMQHELVRQNQRVSASLAEIRGLYDALDRDLSDARQLQESLLRETFRKFGDSSVALCLRSSGHVGGDLVGLVPVSDSRIMVYSLDVSGHGVTSALLTARLAGLLGTPAPEQNIAMVQDGNGDWQLLDPAEVARRLNQTMLDEIETDLYFTLALTDIDISSGMVRMVQAGHPHPAILRADNSVEWVGSGGLPIGLLPDIEFDTVEFRLKAGDRLFLYTDGMTECTGASGEMLDEEGLCQILQGVSPSHETAFLDAVLLRLEAFAGGRDFDDDISAAVFEFNPSQA